MNKHVEHELLIALTRFAFTLPEALERSVGALQVTSVDWSWIACEAVRHRVPGTVQAALETLGLVDRLDPASLELLQTRTWRNRERWNWLRQELSAVVETMRGAGVAISVLRGPVIAHLYHEPHWRYFKDFDLLIYEADAAKVGDMLQQMGYVQGNLDRQQRTIRPMTEQDMLRQTQEKRIHAYLKPFPDNSSFFIIEPHVRLFTTYEPYKLSGQTLLDLPQNSNILGAMTGLPVISAEAFLLELCIHIHSHAMYLPALRSGTDLLLYRWLDLAVLLTKLGTGIDWGHFLQLVDQYNLAFPAAYGLAILSKLYGVTMPGLHNILATDFERRCCGVWYFDAQGSYRLVAELSVGPLTRLFDRQCYGELAQWELTAALDETKVLNPHL